MSAKIYDYHTCYEIAKQCSCSSDFKKMNGSAYNAALKNKWIKDYVWFARKQHAPYTYEEVFEIAKEYNCSSDFQKGNGSAYGKARDMGWIKDYTWFVVKQHAPYTYEECFEIAKQYNTRTEYAHGNVGAYQVALEHGWLDDYTWFHYEQRPSGYWTKERVIEESRRYKSRGDFAIGNGTAYGKARENGWLDECTWLKDERIDFSNDKIDCVYAYEFTDFNSVYVGRTLKRRKKDRDKEHLFIDSDTVSLFARKNDSPVPDMKILEDNLTIAEGVEREAYYVELYRKRGWVILNRAKTGSIGLLAKDKWTRQACYNEALKYKSKTDFYSNNGAAYDAARRNKWLKDYTWFEEKQKPKGYWHDYDNCYNAASKCKTISEFMREFNPAYVWAKKQGWIKDYSWFPPSTTKKKWYYENCFEEAQKYRLMSEFENNSKGAYGAAKRYGWLNDYNWLIRQHRPNGYWNYDHCYEEAKKYNSSSEFQKKNQTAWIAARKNKWLKDYTWFVNPNVKWTYETCKATAKTCKSRHEFSRRYSGAYTVARNNGWLDEYTWFIKKPNAKWTYGYCKGLAATVKGRDDFAKKYGERAASTCRKNGWFDEFFPKKSDSCNSPLQSTLF